MALQLHHGVVVTRFERQITVLRIAFQQPPSLQKPRNPVADGMQECLEFLDVWRLYPLKTQLSIPVLNIDAIEKEHVKVYLIKHQILIHLFKLNFYFYYFRDDPDHQ